ncbi:unnamed protein product [Allacma fusca]|uniref:Uncharacterized protein n=1 Tax=Allacma fusca TaxID=39272 RepID=A0A8J2LM03_9HEXA|nr:unnamed protein product [Allacma fusca]
MHSTELEDNSYTAMGHPIPVYYLMVYLYRFVYYIIKREREVASYQYPSLAVVWTCPADAKLANSALWGSIHWSWELSRSTIH